MIPLLGLGGLAMEKKTNKTKQSSHIQSVEKAILILDILSKKNEGMSLTQISQKLKYPKSTVHGILATLRDYKFVEQFEETGNYKLGTRLFELGNKVARSWDIRDAAIPIMKKLNKQFGETVHLGAEDNGDMLYLEKIDANHLINISSEVGVRLPMHCSGLGKVLLAQKSPAELKRFINQKGLPALTRRTITTQSALEKELEKIRKQGYAIDDGEIMEGLRCVAAPIKDANGIVRYAISISAQVRDLYGTRLNQVIQETVRAANQISKELKNL